MSACDLMVLVSSYHAMNACRGRKVAIDVARGLHFLHSRKRAIIHFDLKVNHFHLKVSDHQHGASLIFIVGCGAHLC